MSEGGTAVASDEPPFFRLSDRPPSLLTMLRKAMSDPASVIPSNIYSDWALQLPGPTAPLVITRPETVRTVLLDKGEVFGRNRQLRALMRRAWGQGLAAAEGEPWARQRRAAAPAFRPEAVIKAATTMAEVAARAALLWPVGEPIELDRALGKIVAEIVMTTLLTGLDDVNYEALAQDVPEFVKRAAKFGMLDVLPLPEMMLDRLRGIGRGDAEFRLRRLAARLAMQRAHGPDPQIDLPALMRGAEPLADNILGFMPAGFETSARAAAWAIYLLARYPDWQEAVRDEALVAPTNVDPLTALPTAGQVAQEVLRLYPPAPLLVRSAVVPTEVEGIVLRTGQVVIMPIFAIHRHTRLWTCPNSFNPSRFAVGQQYDRSAFLPFGAGPRLCIAAHFALTEIAVVVSELVKAFRFFLAGPEPEVSLRLTTHAANGLRVQAIRRS